MLFRKAIMIIHGFAGGTYDQEELANYLELNRAFDVYQFTLPGHNKNLGKAMYQDWINASENQINILIRAGYKTIYLIGHSMGGVIATYLTTKYSQVKKLVLAAPAFHYFGGTDKNIDISESLKTIPKLLKTYKGEDIIDKILKLNPSALREFMELIKEYYDCPMKVKCPVLLLQGKKDNVVPISSSRYVYSNIKSKNKTLIYLEESNHEIFSCNDKIQIYSIVQRFLKANIKGGEITL